MKYVILALAILMTSNAMADEPERVYSNNEVIQALNEIQHENYGAKMLLEQYLMTMETNYAKNEGVMRWIENQE